MVGNGRFGACVFEGGLRWHFFFFFFKSFVFTLSPIIMEVENHQIERKLILEGPIFHFHDYGRKGKPPKIWDPI